MHELLSPTLLPLVALLIGLLAFAIWKQDHTRRQWAAWLCSIILLLIWLLTEVWTVSPSNDNNWASLLAKHQLYSNLAWYLTLCSTVLLWLSLRSTAPVIKIVLDTLILLFLVFGFLTIWGMVWMGQLLSNPEKF
jgi:hypothetical protein